MGRPPESVTTRPPGSSGPAPFEAEIGQDQAVHHAHVPGGMPQPDPPPRRGPVEGVPVRVGAELVLVVAGPDHPVPRGRRLRPAGNRRVQLVEAADRGRAQVDFGQGHAEPDHVVVRVVEPGQHRRAAQVDHPGGARRVRVQGFDPAARDGDRRGPRPGRGVRVHGQHVRVDQRQVGHGATGRPDQADAREGLVQLVFGDHRLLARSAACARRRWPAESGTHLTAPSGRSSPIQYQRAARQAGLGAGWGGAARSVRYK